MFVVENCYSSYSVVSVIFLNKFFLAFCIDRLFLQAKQEREREREKRTMAKIRLIYPKNKEGRIILLLSFPFSPLLLLILLMLLRRLFFNGTNTRRIQTSTTVELAHCRLLTPHNACQCQ